VQETLHYYINGVAHDVPKTRNLDGTYTYDSEGRMASVNYPATCAWNGTQVAPATGSTYTYAFDAML
jgi:hypothetical protein